MNSMTIITDHRGQFLVPDMDLREPECGSVVLTDGQHGTAWQRFFSDGRWHPTRGGGSKLWTELLERRNLIIVYDAEPRAQYKGTLTGRISGTGQHPHLTEIER